MQTWAKNIAVSGLFLLPSCHPVNAHEPIDGCENSCNYEYMTDMPEYCNSHSIEKDMGEWIQVDEKITIILNGKEFTFGFTKP
jgi:DNA repair photolyase